MTGPAAQGKGSRPSLAKKQTRASKAKRDAELDQGIAFTDVDGTRLVVTVGDVRGSHDRALRQQTGYDFVGLLEQLTVSQGTDLLAAVVWFGRLVNDHNTAQSLDELLDEFGYETVLALDLDEGATKGTGDHPEA